MVKNRPSKGITKSGSSQLKHRKRDHARKTGKVLKQDVYDPVIRAAWDNKKNARENLEAIGLVAQVNKRVGKKDAKAKVDNMDSVVVQQLEQIAANGEKERPQHLAEGELKVIEKLISKYGTDYRKMCKDIKLNTMQHTAKVLKRKCKEYYEQTGLEIPEEHSEDDDE